MQIMQNIDRSLSPQTKSRGEIPFPAELMLPDVEGDSGSFSIVLGKFLSSFLKDVRS